MAKHHWQIFCGTIILGFFLSISILAGRNMDPRDFIISIADEILSIVANAFKITNGTEITFIWGVYKTIFAIIGILEIGVTIVSYMLFGWTGIIVALCGFFGILLIFVGGGGIVTIIGLILFIIGCIACNCYD